MGISEFKGGPLNFKMFLNVPHYEEHNGQLSCLAGMVSGWVGRGVYYVPWCFYLAIDCLLQQAKHFSAEQACEQEGGCLVSM